MGRNDHHVDHHGRFRAELEPDVEEMLDHRDMLMEKINDQLRRTGMLKGTGFIVIDPAEPRIPAEEIANKDDAEIAGSNIAYQSRAGYSIIYAPIAVMRPQRPVATSQPSELLKSAGLVAIPAVNQVATAEIPAPKK